MTITVTVWSIRVLMGWYAKIFEKILLSNFFVDKFMDSYATISPIRKILINGQRFLRVFVDKEVLKTSF